MRHLRAAVTTLVLATAVAIPAASAQEPAPVLESCTITPAAVTLRPGEVATVTYTVTPVSSEALFTVTLDGTVVSDGFALLPDESPLEAPFGYDDLATELSEDLGRPVTEGVVVFIYSVEIDSGDPGDVEVLCTLTITLSIAPPPTTTTTETTTTDAAEAAPRFTG